MARFGVAALAVLAAIAAGVLASRLAGRATRPDAPAAIASGSRVTILTEPGADVYTGTRHLGRADVEGNAGPFGLDPGSHTIRVAIEEVGFERERTVEVAAGHIHEFEIRGRKGFLSLKVQPWARVEVDGHDMGLTPLPNLQLFEGTHDLVLENPDLAKRWEGQVRIEAGQVKELKVSLADSGRPM